MRFADAEMIRRVQRVNVPRFESDRHRREELGTRVDVQHPNVLSERVGYNHRRLDGVGGDDSHVIRGPAKQQFGHGSGSYSVSIGREVFCEARRAAHASAGSPSAMREHPARTSHPPLGFQLLRSLSLIASGRVVVSPTPGAGGGGSLQPQTQVDVLSEHILGLLQAWDMPGDINPKAVAKSR